ncbi:MAG: hypothetical protein AAFX02_05720 [Pseudomonadota bacterium]
MTSSPETGQFVTYSILSNGSAIPDTVEIVSIKTSSVLNQVPSATIRIAGSDPGGVSVVNGAQFAPGAEIEIRLGYDHTVAPVFRGLVGTLRLTSSAETGPVIEVECFHKAIRLIENRINRVFEGRSDQSILTTIISDRGLEATVGPTEGIVDALVQEDMSDWDLLTARAAVNSLFVNCQPDGSVKIEAIDLKAATRARLTYGDNIFDLSVETSALDQVKKLNIHTADGAVITAAAAPSSGWGNLSAATLADVLDAHQDVVAAPDGVWRASSKQVQAMMLLSQSLAATIGEIITQGASLYEPGAMVEIDGVGSRFDGSAMISGVHHEAEDGHWETSLELGLAP